MKPGFWKKQREKTALVISRILFWFIKKVNNLDYKLTSYKYNPNSKFFEDLAPSRHLKDEKVYTEAIAWALRNEEIKNIALTGPYGSGKSSILRSFEDQNRQYNYLNISLATFDENVPDDDSDQRKLVETSILQQIFYHVKQAQIPDSRLRRINRLTNLGQMFATLCIVSWLICTTYIFQPLFFQKLQWFKEVEKVGHEFVDNLTFSVFIAGLAFAVFYFFRFVRNSKLSKMSLAGNEVELARDENSSILNKHLDEILYFFESTPFNVVIIEDLDRFKDPEIFTKLREINNLLNSSKQINRKVVFIYAIKDDMFKDKSRTKFFEFIIPVIPVINSSNSIDKLLEKLKSSNLDSISEDFVNDITLYIEDMRMLKNVINEYIIYKDKIGKKLNQEKLLGMMIYKNIYPDDFSALHINKGKVYSIINKKEQYIKTLAEEFDRKIKEKEELIKKVGDTVFKNIQELRSVYLLYIVQKMPQQNEVGTISFDSQRFTIEELLQDSPFTQLVQSRKLQYYHYGYGNLGISFKQVETEIDANNSYIEREKIVKLKASTEIAKLKNELNVLRSGRNAINEKSISEILKTSPVDLIQDFQEDKLLIYLLRYGYIDEQYYSYISYFYEGSITKEDNDFILSVKSKELKPYNFKLTKTEQLIKRLRVAEFDLPEILNYDLMDFLLSKDSEYRLQLSRILSQIKSGQEKAIQFLDGYLDNGSNKPKFVELISSSWNGFWQFISKESGYVDEKKDAILKLLISNSSVDNIIMMNENSVLADYLSEKKNFLLFFKDHPFQNRIKEILLKLNVKFSDLEYDPAASGLFDFIYLNNLYKINEKMTSLIVEKKSFDPSINADLLKHAHYTTIQKSGCDHLKTYIQQNLEAYISHVFLVLPDNNNESEEYVIELLNKEQLPVELKQQIIEKQDLVIGDINAVTTGVWDPLFISSAIKPVWSNVLGYYEHFQVMEEPLLQFLNNERNYKSLSTQVLTDDIQSSYEKANDFINDVGGGYGIDDEAYKNLLLSIDFIFDDMDFSSLSRTKVAALVQQNKLGLNEKHFSALKSRFSPYHIGLSEQHTEEFISSIDEYTLGADDFDALLKSNRFNTQQKLIMLEKMDDGLIKSENGLPDTLYGMVAQGYILPEPVLNRLIDISSATKKLRLITRLMNHLSLDQVTNVLRQVGMPYSMITTRSRPAFEDNEINTDLLEALERKGFISSYSKQDGKLRVYPRNR